MVIAKNQVFVTMAVFSNEQQKLKDYVASLVIGRHYVITNFKVNPQDQERKLKRVNADYGIVLDIHYPPPFELKEERRIISDRKPNDEQKSFYSDLTPSKEPLKTTKPKVPRVEHKTLFDKKVSLSNLKSDQRSLRYVYPKAWRRRIC